ncbi:MAG: glycosyltransferase [Lachnospiraceae bacterium]|nr:glycosyltransferase [Lachnospiraceae bacterium]
MKFVHITEASATSAPVRVSDAISGAGVESHVLIRNPGKGVWSSAKVVKRPGLAERKLDVIRQKMQRKLMSAYPEKDDVQFSLGISGTDITSDPLVKEADIVNLHWTCMGYLSIKSISKLLSANKDLVWTMHDCWPLSGGCHYGCDRFEDSCGKCPVLHSSDENDVSFRVLKKKLKFWKGRGIVTVSPSRWLRDRADRSAVFGDGRNEYIPNPVDAEVFGMKDGENRKNRPFRLLFGAAFASSPYKGFEYLEKMLLMIRDREPEIAGNIQVVVFGVGDIRSSVIEGFNHEYTGYVNGEAEMAKLYRSADLMVVPSLEDNFPGTVLEAMSCGTPVLGFETGGIPDMVDSMENGYVAPKGDAEGLFEGFKWVYSHNEGNRLGIAAGKKVRNNYTPDIIGRKYRELYEDILGGRR